MADQADDRFSEVVSFDFLPEDLLDSDIILSENIDPANKEDIMSLVEQLNNATSREVIDFVSQDTPQLPLRHKGVTDAELDRLAAKNSAEATIYQTKWAITVFKGKKFDSKALIFKKSNKT